MRRVATSMLTENMILGRSIMQSGRIFLRTGAMNLNKYRSAIEQLGITNVYVEDVSSEGIVIHDVLDEEVRVNAKQTLLEVFQRYQTRSVVNLAPLIKPVDEMATAILYAQPAALSLNDVDAKEDRTITHSVNTAVYAGLICREMEMDKNMMMKIILGAMLIDLGLMKINPKILIKRQPWTPEETAEYREHPNIGYEAVSKCPELTELTRNIIQTHHELLDGSGYPKRLRDSRLTEAARIVAVASRFDELSLGTLDGEPGHSVHEAMELLMKESASKLDASISAILMRRIAIYPNGCMVRLSNKQSGIVKEQNPGMAYRPVVRMLLHDEEKGNYFKDVDLMKELSLTIQDAELEMENGR